MGGARAGGRALPGCRHPRRRVRRRERAQRVTDLALGLLRRDDGDRHGGRSLGLAAPAANAHGPAHVLVAGTLAGGGHRAAFPESRVASTIGVALFVMGPIAFAQMALSYPSGSFVRSRLAWVYVFVLGYAAQVVQNAYNLLYLDLSACPVCPPPRVPTLLHVDSAPPIALQDWNDGWLVFVMAILPIGLFVLYRAYATASPGHRRSLAPVVLTASFLTCTSWITSYAVLTERFGVLTPVSWLQTTGALVAALTALLGVAMTRWARGSVADLVVELEQVGPGAVRSALSRTLGDPTLQLALRLPDRGVWVDDEGRESRFPPGASARSRPWATTWRRSCTTRAPRSARAARGRRLGCAARARERASQGRLRVQLDELRRSRARIVLVADEERRRLERDLHDGVQQRLLGIALTLGGLRPRIHDDAPAVRSWTTPRARCAPFSRRCASSHGGSTRRAHGRGAGGGGPDAGAADAGPCLGRAPPDRFPAHIESAAYFVVAEGLANVTKHAHATAAAIAIGRSDGLLSVEVRDDGVGGARAGEMSGLRGLGDRVGALDGRLRVDSPPGQAPVFAWRSHASRDRR